jgi:hypothetical protein
MVSTRNGSLRASTKQQKESTAAIDSHPQTEHSEPTVALPAPENSFSSDAAIPDDKQLPVMTQAPPVEVLPPAPTDKNPVPMDAAIPDDKQLPPAPDKNLVPLDAAIPDDKQLPVMTQAPPVEVLPPAPTDKNPVPLDAAIPDDKQLSVVTQQPPAEVLLSAMDENSFPLDAAIPDGAASDDTTASKLTLSPISEMYNYVPESKNAITTDAVDKPEECLKEAAGHEHASSVDEVQPPAIFPATEPLDAKHTPSQSIVRDICSAAREVSTKDGVSRKRKDPNFDLGEGNPRKRVAFDRKSTRPSGTRKLAAPQGHQQRSDEAMEGIQSSPTRIITNVRHGEVIVIEDDDEERRDDDWDDETDVDDKDPLLRRLDLLQHQLDSRRHYLGNDTLLAWGEPAFGEQMWANLSNQLFDFQVGWNCLRSLSSLSGMLAVNSFHLKLKDVVHRAQSADIGMYKDVRQLVMAWKRMAGQLKLKLRNEYECKLVKRVGISLAELRELT